MRMDRTRLLFLAIFLACCGLLGYGMYLQLVAGLEPCPLCILQRYAFVVAGVGGLGGALLGRERAWAWGFGLLVAAAGLTGAGIAARQIWLQHYPPVAVECGPDLAYLLNNLPWAQAIPKLFHGEGDCAAVTWRFLGLSIAEWALPWFLVLALAGLLAPRLRVRRWPSSR